MEQKKTLTRDMTSGNAMELIWQFSVPLLLGNIFQQMYNLIDTAIVGRYLGISALSSVGSTGAICFLIIGLCLGMCAGFAIPIAQQFGAKAYSVMRNYVMNAAYLAAIMAIGYWAVCFTDQTAWVSATIVVLILFTFIMKNIRKKYNKEI